MVVHAYINAQHFIGDIEVARITVVVAVRNAKCKFTSAESIAVVDRKKPCWSAHRAARAN